MRCRDTAGRHGQRRLERLKAGTKAGRRGEEATTPPIVPHSLVKKGTWVAQGKAQSMGASTSHTRRLGVYCAVGERYCSSRPSWEDLMAQICWNAKGARMKERGQGDERAM